ncbi:LuxR family transcriptional regulator [Pseudomonas sp. GD03855]|jgi:LuxR family transcriptional regulator, quorum-sensing system regulator LasR|nr:LuxR family transcriptional regulator [Pseudomonas sp. GD03856]MDH2265728.1 LuxR family transcriptional regulator [Pseudomonas sp. GD03855]
MNEFAELLTATSLTEWFSRLVRLSASVNAEQVLFALKKEKLASNDNAIVLSTYPSEWRQKYDENGYASVDPVVQKSFASALPIFWDRSIYETFEQLAFYEEAAAYGLIQGITLPLHGPGGETGLLSFKFTLSDKMNYTKTIERYLPIASLLRDYAISSSTALLKLDQKQKVNLTSREYEVLKWCAVGKTAWETSMILSCSEATINFHLKNIRRKYGVDSKGLAVVRAIQNGDIII